MLRRRPPATSPRSPQRRDGAFWPVRSWPSRCPSIGAATLDEAATSQGRAVGAAWLLRWCSASSASSFVGELKQHAAAGWPSGYFARLGGRSLGGRRKQSLAPGEKPKSSKSEHGFFSDFAACQSARRAAYAGRRRASKHAAPRAVRAARASGGALEPSGEESHQTL